MSCELQKYDTWEGFKYYYCDRCGGGQFMPPVAHETRVFIDDWPPTGPITRGDEVICRVCAEKEHNEEA